MSSTPVSVCACKASASANRKYFIGRLWRKAFHNGDAQKDNRHRRDLQPPEWLAIKRIAEDRRNHRIDICIKRDNSDRQVVQRVEVCGVANQRSKDHQIKECGGAARAPLNLVTADEHGRQDIRQSGDQLLYARLSKGMSPKTAALLKNRTQRPG